MKEVKEAFRFVNSSDMWNMLLWTIALVSSYLQLLRARIFGSKSTPISSSIDPKLGSSRPICVITGVSKVNVLLFTFNLLRTEDLLLKKFTDIAHCDLFVLV